MALEKIHKKQTNTKANFVPYEKENKIDPLKLYIIIVPFGQADNIIKQLESIGISCNFITAGEGTGKNFMPGLISSVDSKKQIIMSFVKENMAEKVNGYLKQRFNTSKAARGIGVSVKLTSVAGVSIYRFLTNTRKVQKAK